MLERSDDNRLEDALACFDEALSVNNQYAMAYNARGLVHLALFIKQVLDKMKQHEDAYQDFTKSINLEPNNYVFTHNRACCMRNMGKL